VQVLQQTAPVEDASLAGAQYQAADDPVEGSSGIERALAAGPAPGEEVVFAPDPSDPSALGASAAALAGGAAALAGGAAARPGAELAGASVSRVAERQAADPDIQQPMVRDSAFDRAGRNDPCPCGSGKKFKFCHGR
jgi:hypothetical protein